MRREGFFSETLIVFGVIVLLSACSGESIDDDLVDGGNEDADITEDADIAEDAGREGDADSGEDADIGDDADTVADADFEGDAEELDSGEPEIPQPLFDDVATLEMTLPRAGADPDETTVYYPNPADLGTGGYSLPVVLFFQGANVDRAHYSSFATSIARHGFIVVIPNHYSTTLLGRGLYAQASEIDATLEWARAEDLDESSPLHGVIDEETLVVMGHSYGGVCGLNAVQEVCQAPSCSGGFTRPVELLAGVFWGTNLVPPWGGGVPPIANDGLPVALIQGSLDSMAPVGKAERTYDQIQDPPRAMVLVEGANHYGICDVNNPEGARRDNTAPTLEQATGVEVIGRWAALFLRAYLFDDAAALDWVEVTGDDLDPIVTVTRD